MSCSCSKIEKVRIKKMFPEAIEPKRGTDGSAGYDLHACDATVILPKKSCMITTGIAMEIPSGYVGLVFARSGLATKQGIRPANCVGVIDSYSEQYLGRNIAQLESLDMLFFCRLVALQQLVLL